MNLSRVQKGQVQVMKMKSAFKKIIAVLMCAAAICTVFAGCSSTEVASDITDETMLIAYTDAVEPFLTVDDKGKVNGGFDYEVVNQIIESIKNDYKDYQFVKVDEGYKVGEDTAYTDKDGNEYVANMMIGGVQKDNGTVDEEYSFTNDVITNRVVTVTSSAAGVANYNDLSGKKAGVVTDIAQAALEENLAVKNSLKSVKKYGDIKSALADLSSGKIDAVITDEFSFCTQDNKDDFTVLDGELGSVRYAYMFKKGDSLAETVNEAIYELQSKDYNDADQFTPIVEKYFGYDASSFDYVPSDTK